MHNTLHTHNLLNPLQAQQIIPLVPSILHRTYLLNLLLLYLKLASYYGIMQFLNFDWLADNGM